jgi:hypothetical protein
MHRALGKSLPSSGRRRIRLLGVASQYILTCVCSCSIIGSQSNGYEELHLKDIRTCSRRNVLSLLSKLNNKPRKKPAWNRQQAELWYSPDCVAFYTRRYNSSVVFGEMNTEWVMPRERCSEWGEPEICSSQPSSATRRPDTWTSGVWRGVRGGRRAD